MPWGDALEVQNETPTSVLLEVSAVEEAMHACMLAYQEPMEMHACEYAHVLYVNEAHAIQ